MHTDNLNTSMNEESGKRQMLEIEGEEERQRRLEKTFYRLNAGAVPAFSLPSFNFAENTELRPPTELLSRVQAFLPQIQAANSLLAEQDPNMLDIENLDDEPDQYIEMNLGLGVFEDRSSKDMDTDMQNESSSDTSDSSTESDDGYSTDQSSVIITCFRPGPRPIKPLPRRASSRPQIVILDDGRDDSCSSSPLSS